MLKQGLQCDSDRLHCPGSGHAGILQRIGIAPILEKPKESMQTIARHVRMLTPELLDAINKEVVAAGQRLVGCQAGERSAGAVRFLRGGNERGVSDGRAAAVGCAEDTAEADGSAGTGSGSGGLKAAQEAGDEGRESVVPGANSTAVQEEQEPCEEVSAIRRGACEASEGDSEKAG